MWKCVRSTWSSVRPSSRLGSLSTRRSPVPASIRTAASLSSGRTSMQDVSRRSEGTKPPLPRIVAAATVLGRRGLGGGSLVRGRGLDHGYRSARLNGLALLDREDLDGARLVGRDL